MRDLPMVADFAEAAGFEVAAGPAAAGDVLLYHIGPCQFHFGIAARNGGIVHAHAGLRRVICCERIPDWELAGHWRIAE